MGLLLAVLEDEILEQVECMGCKELVECNAMAALVFFPQLLLYRYILADYSSSKWAPIQKQPASSLYSHGLKTACNLVY